MLYPKKKNSLKINFTDLTKNFIGCMTTMHYHGKQAKTNNPDISTTSQYYVTLMLIICIITCCFNEFNF